MLGAWACGGSCAFFFLQATLSNNDKIRTEAVNWWRQVFMRSVRYRCRASLCLDDCPGASEQSNCSQ